MNKKQRGTRVKITERALFQRINRKLKHDDEKLCTARPSDSDERGRFYIVETGQHVRGKRALFAGVVHVNVNLEKFARKLGVIQPWEELEGEK